MNQRLKLRNRYRFVFEGDVSIVRRNGSVDRFTRLEVSIKNLLTDEGLNDVLSKYYKGSSYSAAFFMLLIDANGFTAIAADDTAAQIGGTNDWEEITSEYDQSTRPSISFGSVASQSVDGSAAPCVFTVNAEVTIQGAGIVTNSTKGGTSGVLVGVAELDDPVTIGSGSIQVYPVCSAESA